MEEIKLHWWDKKEIRFRTSKEKIVFNVLDEAFKLLDKGGELETDFLVKLFADIKEKYNLVYPKIYEEYFNEIIKDPDKTLQYWKEHNPNPLFVTKRGVKVRSKSEKIIADFYYDNGIKFYYETALKIGGEIIHPDFFLPDLVAKGAINGEGITHEHFGLDNEEYLKNRDSKIKKYRSMPFIYTDLLDDHDLGKAIVRKLNELGVDLSKHGL